MVTLVCNCFVCLFDAQEVNLQAELLDRALSQACVRAVLDDSGMVLAFSLLVASRQDCPSVFRYRIQLEGAPPATLCTPIDHLSQLFQPQPRWRKLVCLLPVPPGCRKVTVSLFGKDTRFWAGHYGPKFASAELTFLPRQSLPAVPPAAAAAIDAAVAGAAAAAAASPDLRIAAATRGMDWWAVAAAAALATRGCYSPLLQRLGAPAPVVPQWAYLHPDVVALGGPAGEQQAAASASQQTSVA